MQAVAYASRSACIYCLTSQTNDLVRLLSKYSVAWVHHSAQSDADSNLRSIRTRAQHVLAVRASDTDTATYPALLPFRSSLALWLSGAPRAARGSDALRRVGRLALAHHVAAAAALP
eukprot:5046524-Pleurochrysis_carterae.AAC.1